MFYLKRIGFNTRKRSDGIGPLIYVCEFIRIHVSVALCRVIYLYQDLQESKPYYPHDPCNKR